MLSLHDHDISHVTMDYALQSVFRSRASAFRRKIIFSRERTRWIMLFLWPGYFSRIYKILRDISCRVDRIYNENTPSMYE